MRFVLFILVWVSLQLSGAVPALAQAGGVPPPPGSIEHALAIEDPEARIAALQKFLKTNNLPEQARTAREAIVASWAQLAEKQLSQNNIEKAVADFRRAIAGLPPTVSDRFFVDTVIRIPQATSMRGYRPEAVELARLLEKRYSKDPLKLAAIGEYYMTIEAPADAIRCLELAAGLKDQEAQVHRLLGAAYRLGLRLDDAIHEYQLTIGRNREDKRAYYELANLYRAHGAYTDAIGLYQKQLAIEPRHSPSYKGLALAYLAMGEEEQFNAALRKVRELNESGEDVTQDIYLQTQLAFIYLAQRRLPAARQAAEAALVVEPRYAWARIAAAEVDLAEGKYFEAERNLLAARNFANFPTLRFTLGKLYLAVEDFDGALEQFAQAFQYSEANRFSTQLGGTLPVSSESLRELLSREHQAAIFLAESPTSPELFQIAESLVRLDAALRGLSKANSPEKARAEALQNADRFLDAEKSRRAFRALYLAQRLVSVPDFAPKVIELADAVLGMAAIATELDGSLRDYPNYDRDGRLRIVSGRAWDLKGWALYKAGKQAEATSALIEAVRAYGPLPEVKRALWRLAIVKETGGELPWALDLYLAGYQAPEKATSADVNRTVIELLYRRVNGSLDGLDERLRQSADGPPVKLLADLLGVTAPVPQKSSPAPVRQSTELATAPKPSMPRSPFSLLRIEPAPNPGEKKPAAQPVTLPRTDPMFARPESKLPGESAAPGKPIPVALPTLPLMTVAITDPLTPPVNQQKFFARWDSFSFAPQIETPPPPTATRKRRVKTEDPPN